MRFIRGEASRDRHLEVQTLRDRSVLSVLERQNVLEIWLGQQQHGGALGDELRDGRGGSGVS